MLKPWQRQEWCIAALTPEFVWRMEALLDLYAEPADPARPVICLDERPLPLKIATIPPIPAQPGQVARHDATDEHAG